jgi:predicted dehydrogenase
MSVTEPVRVFDKQVTADETRPSFIDSYASFRASVREGDILIPRVGGPAPLTAEVEHFLDCIQGKATPVTDGRFGASVVRALAAIDHSVREQGREVPVAST